MKTKAFWSPDIAMNGSILPRGKTAAPAKEGIINSGWSSSPGLMPRQPLYGLSAQDLFHDMVPNAAKNLAEQMGRN